MRVCIIPGCPFVQYAIWAGSCVFRIVDVLICSLYRQVVCELMERVARMSMYFHKGRSVSRVLSRPYQRHDDMHHINILYLSGRGAKVAAAIPRKALKSCCAVDQDSKCRRLPCTSERFSDGQKFRPGAGKLASHSNRHWNGNTIPAPICACESGLNHP